MNILARVLLGSTVCVPFISACGGEDKHETKAADKTVVDTAKDMAKDVGEATVKKFNELKETYAKDSEGKLGGFDKTIEELKKKASGLSGDAKSEVEKLLAQIKEKRAEASKAIGELKSQGQGAYESFKKSLDEKLADLQKLIDNASSKTK